MTKLGQKLIKAAEEARAIARGEADPSTYRIHVPPEIDVKGLRKSLPKVLRCDVTRRVATRSVATRSVATRREAPRSKLFLA